MQILTYRMCSSVCISVRVDTRWKDCIRPPERNIKYFVTPRRLYAPPHPTCQRLARTFGMQLTNLEFEFRVQNVI